MKLQELKRQIEAQYPGKGRIVALGLDNLPAGAVAEDPEAKQFPPIEDLRLQQLVDLLERGNPDYTSGVSSVKVHPGWANSQYYKGEVDLGLKRFKGGEYSEPMSPANMIQALIHEITHNKVIPLKWQGPAYDSPIPLWDYYKLLNQPGGRDVPAMAGSGYDLAHHAEYDEIAPNVMGWAISRYLFPEEGQQPERWHPKGFEPAANEVVRIMQLSDFAEQGLP